MTLTSADRIRETLEHLIVAGEFANGERLDEATLSQRFAVSRTPVREALRALSASGLAEVIPRRGVFVRHPGFIDLVEMFEVMAELEAMCGRLAARRISDEALDELARADTACQEALERGNSDDYYHENERFHHTLYRASGNSFLAESAARLHRRLQPYRRLQLRVRGRMDQSLREHRAIIEAIRAGDCEATSQALRAHIAIQGEKFNDLMASMNRPRDTRQTAPK